MSTEIEIIEVDGSRISVAFYYPIPDAIYSELAQTDRNPRGTSLTPAQVTEFRAGRLYEHLNGYSIAGRTRAQIMSLLEAEYTNRREQARDEYIREYSARRAYFDGTNWHAI